MAAVDSDDASLAASLDGWSAWWQRQHNIARGEAAISASSMAKHRERLLLFVAFCKSEGGGPVASVEGICDDLERFQRFLDGQLHNSAGYRACLCNAMLAALKFRHQPVDEACPPHAIAAVRRLRNQLQRAYEVDLKSRSSRDKLVAANKVGRAAAS